MSKPPRAIFENVYAFPPNRDTLGGTAYFIVGAVANQPQGISQNLLIDAPYWEAETEAFLKQHGGVTWLFITHRSNIGKAAQISAALHCPILIQEQEAYLLPDAEVKPFQGDRSLGDGLLALWTPGHSPGSSCLYYSTAKILFSGRHLLPDRQGNPAPLRTAKTFQWHWQLRSVRALIDRFDRDTLAYICPGGSVGFLRGKGAIDRAYEKLLQLDLDACLVTKPLI